MMDSNTAETTFKPARSSILLAEKEEMMKKGRIIGKAGMYALVLLIALVLPLTAYAADKLVVKDSGGNTKFLVTDSGLVTASGAGDLVELISDGSYAAMRYYAYRDNAFTHGFFGARAARGSLSLPLAMQNGDQVMSIRSTAYDGIDWNHNVASLEMEVDGVITTGHTPGRIVLKTSDSVNNLVERMRISSSGYVGFGRTPSYPIHMASGAYVTTGGVWTNASSKDYKENIQKLNTEEALLAFNRLEPVKYNYKADIKEKHLGFIAEDVPELVASQDRKGLSPMDIIAVLTKVVQEQERTIKELSEKIQKIESLVR